MAPWATTCRERSRKGSPWDECWLALKLGNRRHGEALPRLGRSCPGPSLPSPGSGREDTRSSTFYGGKEQPWSDQLGGALTGKALPAYRVVLRPLLQTREHTRHATRKHVQRPPSIFSCECPSPLRDSLHTVLLLRLLPTRGPPCLPRLKAGAEGGGGGSVLPLGQSTHVQDVLLPAGPPSPQRQPLGERRHHAAAMWGSRSAAERGEQHDHSHHAAGAREKRNAATRGRAEAQPGGGTGCVWREDGLCVRKDWALRGESSMITQSSCCTHEGHTTRL